MSRQTGSRFTWTAYLEVFHLFTSGVLLDGRNCFSPVLFGSNSSVFHCMLKAFPFCFFFLEVGGGREDWAFQKAYNWQDSLFPSNSLWNSCVCTNISLACMWNAFSSWEKCSLQKLPVCKQKIGFKRQLWWEQCLREMQLGLEVNWMLYKNVVLSLHWHCM